VADPLRQKAIVENIPMRGFVGVNVEPSSIIEAISVTFGI
jgi:hypothetical protein